MVYKVELSFRARQELIEAWTWYESRQQGLGDRFETEVYKSIQEVQQHPLRSPEKIQFYREKQIMIFPYLIIYMVIDDNNTILISSIFHTRRNPQTK